jgi:hypothetical protein
MKRIAVATALLSAPVIALAQWNLPPESQRCPSKWGAGDELGSGNHMKNPQNVLRAAKLIKTGEVIELGYVLGPGMPPIWPNSPVNISSFETRRARSPRETGLRSSACRTRPLSSRAAY